MNKLFLLLVFVTLAMTMFGRKNFLGKADCSALETACEKGSKKSCEQFNKRCLPNTSKSNISSVNQDEEKIYFNFPKVTSPSTKEEKVYFNFN